LVHQVDANSQAAVAGVGPGMKLVSVDGLEVAELEADRLERLLTARPPNKPCRLSFAVRHLQLTPDEEVSDDNSKKQRRELLKIRNRQLQLQQVFQVFDLNNNKCIERDELMQIGQMREHLGHNIVHWTSQQNEDFITQLDKNKGGIVQEDEFVQAFEAMLPKDSATFDAIVDEFVEAAKTVRQGIITAYHDEHKQRGGLASQAEEPGEGTRVHALSWNSQATGFGEREPPPRERRVSATKPQTFRELSPRFKRSQ